jgi:hypothetical protein
MAALGFGEKALLPSRWFSAKHPLIRGVVIPVPFPKPKFVLFLVLILYHTFVLFLQSVYSPLDLLIIIYLFCTGMAGGIHVEISQGHS